MIRRVLFPMLLIGALYAAAIFVGLHIKNLSGLINLSSLTASKHSPLPIGPSPLWSRDLPAGAAGDSIRLGELIFKETPLYAAKYTRSRISCSNCHLGGGTQRFASPMLGLPALFPMFNARAGHVISLEDRVQECFVRSENGTPLDYKGVEMKAVVDYINWLSRSSGKEAVDAGRGLVQLPDLKPDPDHGAAIYAFHCAGCHGENGQGKPPLFPPLWGPYSFNDGAGMHGIRKMASFVQHNMPQNRMGILSPQDAYDVSAFIHNQPRPSFNKEYAHY